MKRLQTYFALLATLLTLLACFVVIIICFFFFEMDPTAFLLLIPVALVVYPSSLLIGIFLSEPLRTLVKQTQAIRAGIDISLQTDGRMLETDELASNFRALVKKTKTQQEDLELKEHRQAAFISDVAHELRTPLTAIRGNAEMLEDPDLPPELREKFCSIIVSESERLCRLTSDLLALQRIETDTTPPELTRINLHRLANDVIDALDPILRAREAKVTITGSAPDVLGNADQLRQAFTNLIENASRFISVGGHISVELLKMNDNSVVVIKDDGCGFGDINPKLLFDRFYRTDSSRYRGTGGTGLGLAIVKSIVDSHDGSVEAVNLPEGGACFIIALPSIST